MGQAPISVINRQNAPQTSLQPSGGIFSTEFPSSAQTDSNFYQVDKNKTNKEIKQTQQQNKSKETLASTMTNATCLLLVREAPDTLARPSAEGTQLLRLYHLLLPEQMGL